MIDKNQLDANQLNYRCMLEVFPVHLLVENKAYALSGEFYKEFMALGQLSANESNGFEFAGFDINLMRQKLDYISKRIVILDADQRQWMLDEIQYLVTIIQPMYVTRKQCKHSKEVIHEIEEMRARLEIVSNMVDYYNYVLKNKQPLTKQYKAQMAKMHLQEMLWYLKKASTLKFTVSFEMVLYYFMGHMYMDLCVMDQEQIEEEMVYSVLSLTAFENMARLSAEYEMDIKIWYQHIQLGQINTSRKLYQLFKYVKVKESNSYEYCREDCMEIAKNLLQSSGLDRFENYLADRVPYNLQKMFKEAGSLTRILDNLKRTMFYYYEKLMNHFKLVRELFSQQEGVYPDSVVLSFRYEHVQAVLHYVRYVQWVRTQINTDSVNIMMLKMSSRIRHHVKWIQEDYMRQIGRLSNIESAEMLPDWIDSVMDCLIELSGQRP